MKQEYKHTFSFGNVAYNGQAVPTNEVTIEATLSIKENGQVVFSASGNIWNGSHNDIYIGGQCIDTIYNDFKGQIQNRKTYEEIMALWEKWHLNDMNAGCKHQRALKWGTKKLSISKLVRKYEGVGQEISRIEDSAMKTLKEVGSVNISESERKLLNLEYWLTVPTEEASKYSKYYKVENTEEKTSGWVSEDEHPQGVLSKACPECGYKYGSAWVYEPIEIVDLYRILRLLNVTPLTVKEIVNKVRAQIQEATK